MNQSEKWNVTNVGFEVSQMGFSTIWCANITSMDWGSDSLEIVESEDDWYC